ncbi:MAG: hypothetical protein KC733_10385 [Candidatus Omnitrophica bacterium]|nr:hypothetical protein [Candidatus Omnitrophota bacterium]
MTKLFITILFIFLCVPLQAVENPVLIYSFLGFYNSESNEFNPEPIDYTAMVNYDEVYDVVSRSDKNDSYVVFELGRYENSIDLAFKDSTSQQKEQLRILPLTGVYLLNEFLLNEETNPMPIAKELRVPITWRKENVNDRILLVVGLETQTKGEFLRSGLAGMLFNGNGEFIDAAFEVYDFTHYKSQEMVKDILSFLDKFKKKNLLK